MDKEGNGQYTRAPSCCRFPPLYRPFPPSAQGLPGISALVPPIFVLAPETGGTRSVQRWKSKFLSEGRNGRYNSGNRRYEGGNARYEGGMGGRRKSAEMPGRGRKWTVEIGGTRASTPQHLHHQTSTQASWKPTPAAPRPLMVIPDVRRAAPLKAKQTRNPLVRFVLNTLPPYLSQHRRPIVRSWTPQGPIKILVEASVYLQASDIMRETTTETVATR